MKSPEELLNERLEALTARSGVPQQPPSGFLPSPPGQTRSQGIDDLVLLARAFQQARRLQVRPDFARQLERRLQRRQAEVRLQRGQGRVTRSLFARLRVQPVLSLVLGICLLLCLVSTSVLVLAAQVEDPTNPFYGVKRWEQQVQTTLAGNPTNQATLDLQFARDQLNALPSLVGAAHESAYQQELLDLDQQLRAATSAIQMLPAGSSQDQLYSQLASVQKQATQTLYLLLPRLTLNERLETTAELGRLGEPVSQLTRATVILPAHPNGQVVMHLFGQHLTAGAQLLVNGQLVADNGTLEGEQMTFVVNWNRAAAFYSLGLLNPDGTAAQTTTITQINPATTGNGTTGTPPSNGNTNKPTVTPTPNGNKPTATPTPNGKKPAATPTPHH